MTEQIDAYLAWLRERRDRAERELKRSFFTDRTETDRTHWHAVRDTYQQALDMYLELRDQTSAGQGEG